MNNELSQTIPMRRDPVHAAAEPDPIEAGGTDADTGGALGFDIDLRAIWSAIYRNRIIIIAILIVAMLIGLATALLTTPRYLAVASVQIEQQSTKVLQTEDETGASLQDADRFLQTQLDIIQSRALAARVAESLGLLNDDRFLIAMNLRPSNGTIGTLDARASKRERVVRVLMNNLSVELPRNSRIAKIGFSSPDPALAARVANSFARNFITGNLKRRFDTSAYARDFLSDQLSQTKQKLEDSERAMITYARSAQLIDASAGAGTTNGEASSGPRSLTTANLVQLNSAYSTARATRVQAQQRWEQAQATPLMSLPEVLSNAGVQQLSLRRAELKATYEQERQRRKAEYPAMQQAAAEIAEVESQISRLANSVKTAIRDQYLVALKQEQALDNNVGELKSETLAEQDRSIRYNILKREADTNRALYDGLLQRFKEVSAAAGITTNNISVIDDAEQPPAPYLPRPALNMALAAVVGLLLALGLVFVREKFDDTIRSPDDVNRKLGLPFLSSIPLLPAGITPTEALADPRSAFSEAYYALRTALELSSASGLPRSLLLTSSQQAEGKSTTSYAIARDFARIGKHVLLIDADLRKPSLHRTLGADNSIGAANLLAHQKSFAEVVQHTETDNLDFIPCGSPPPNPAELLAGANLKGLIEHALQHYELVVVDGPPVMGLADAPLLAASVEACAFVIEANSSHRGQAKLAIRRLLSARVRLIGTVLTKFDARSTGYSADYGYSYDYGSDRERK